MRIDADTGQLLALFSPPSTTFYCCGRDILNRAKYTHPSTLAHRTYVAGPRPKRSSYIKKLKSERPKRSAFAFVNVEANDDALEAYYIQCAIEDGTYNAISKEYK